jgi:rSAM/selenodomain-associated transferase 1
LTTLIVLAKAPCPGRSKTRLCPPCTPAEAAELAAAALADTLSAVAAAPAARRMLALEGPPGDWIPPGFDVVPQLGGGLAERLAGAFAAADGPALLVGMDTPQATPTDLAAAAGSLHAHGVDAVIGAAPDGGYWTIGLRRADARVFHGVPMSTDRTAAVQRTRFAELGLRYAEVDPLRDVDTIVDARAVAAEAPASRFARRLAVLESRWLSARRPPIPLARASASTP